MTWIDYIAVMVIVFLVLLPFAAREWAFRPHYRRVSHRKLRAASARRGSTAGFHAPCTAPAVDTPLLRTVAGHLLPEDDVPAATPGGSTVAPSGEPHPAGGRHLDTLRPPAGPKQPAVVIPPDRAAAGSQPHDAPAWGSGAGVEWVAR